jgi:RHS repeat-associated protein
MKEAVTFRIREAIQYLTSDKPFSTASRASATATGTSDFGNGIIRWYDPITGRWLSNDPIGISGGLNQYVFCANNPLNYIDPFGLSGTLTIISSRGNNRYGSIGFGNHTLIVYQPDDSDITYKWGTWGREDYGIGLKENFVHDFEYLDDSCASRRSKYIDDNQERILGKSLSKYNGKGPGAWSEWSPCSSFAANAWKAATGEDLADRHLGGLGYSDPNILADGIDRANRNGRK